ncbi:MAG: NTP transferase domain-containing protein [Acidimicrobiaceae bacterium]|nr:NTP transferase domain-containing protein [Acidimicrobiaceae bacterium]MYL04718.1 NTP transferase domain-containing protein [Acidimicrobiaceae bacterium]
MVVLPARIRETCRSGSRPGGVVIGVGRAGGGQTGVVTDGGTSEAHGEDRRLGVAAVVLAAGAGVRFDGERHKLLCEVGGVPLVRRAVDAALAADLDETIVVMGAVDLLAVLPEEVTVLQNEAWEQGQATSLAAAVSYAGSRGHRAVVFGCGDQPGVPASAWAAVAEADCDLAVADFGGARRPPVRIGAALWSHLPLTGDEGGRVLMRRRPELVQAIPCEGNPDDIDTLEDLRKWN